jgi:hypothetical protein
MSTGISLPTLRERLAKRRGLRQIVEACVAVLGICCGALGCTRSKGSDDRLLLRGWGGGCHSGWGGVLEYTNKDYGHAFEVQVVSKADPFRLGIDRAALGDDFPAYIHRSVDGRLENLLANAVQATVTFVVLVGDSKAGKSRSLFHAVETVMADAHLLIPKTVGAISQLTVADLQHLPEGPVILWLDDLEPNVRVGNEGMHPGVLRAIEDPGRVVIVLATYGGTGIKRVPTKERKDIKEPLRDLLQFAIEVPLSLVASPSELADAERQGYSLETVDQLRKYGIGEVMVAGPELARKFQTGRHQPDKRRCPEGVAVVSAAIDWRRVGMPTACSRHHLEQLYTYYAPRADVDIRDKSAFRQGLKWALRPLYNRVSLLEVAQDDAGYKPYDYIVSYVDKELTRDIENAAWSYALKVAKPAEAFAIGVQAHAREQPVYARQAWEQASASADPAVAVAGSTNLGISLAVDDVPAAEAAFRRASELGGGLAGNIWGILAWLKRDLKTAAEAFGFAAEADEPNGAANLGNVLRELNDLPGAEAAYRRSDKLGEGRGAYDYARLLAERGQHRRADAAFRRADLRGDPDAAYHRAWTASQAGDEDEVEWALQRADKSGHSVAPFELAKRFGQRGELKRAEGALRRAELRGHPEAVGALVALLQHLGDLAGAEAAARRGDKRGDGHAALLFGQLLYDRGEFERAKAAFCRAENRGDELAAYSLAMVLGVLGQVESARAALARANGAPDSIKRQLEAALNKVERRDA